MGLKWFPAPSSVLDHGAVGLLRVDEEDDEGDRGYADADEARYEEAPRLVHEAPVDGRHGVREYDAQPIEQPEVAARAEDAYRRRFPLRWEPADYDGDGVYVENELFRLTIFFYVLILIN